MSTITTDIPKRERAMQRFSSKLPIGHKRFAAPPPPSGEVQDTLAGAEDDQQASERRHGSMTSRIFNPFARRRSNTTTAARGANDLIAPQSHRNKTKPPTAHDRDGALRPKAGDHGSSTASAIDQGHSYDSQGRIPTLPRVAHARHSIESTAITAALPPLPRSQTLSHLPVPSGCHQSVKQLKEATFVAQHAPASRFRPFAIGEYKFGVRSAAVKDLENVDARVPKQRAAEINASGASDPLLDDNYLAATSGLSPASCGAHVSHRIENEQELSGGEVCEIIVRQPAPRSEEAIVKSLLPLQTSQSCSDVLIQPHQPHRSIRQRRLLSVRSAITPPLQIKSASCSLSETETPGTPARRRSRQAPIYRLTNQGSVGHGVGLTEAGLCPAKKISTAMPSSYWTGRLSASLDRYCNDELIRAGALTQQSLSLHALDFFSSDAQSGRVLNTLYRLMNLCDTDEARQSFLSWEQELIDGSTYPELRQLVKGGRLPGVATMGIGRGKENRQGVHRWPSSLARPITSKKPTLVGRLIDRAGERGVDPDSKPSVPNEDVGLPQAGPEQSECVGSHHL